MTAERNAALLLIVNKEIQDRSAGVQTKPKHRTTASSARHWGAVSIIQSSKKLHNQIWYYLFCGGSRMKHQLEFLYF